MNEINEMTAREYANYERRVRRLAAKHGLLLNKVRDGRGLHSYFVIRPENSSSHWRSREIVFGDPFVGSTLDEVAGYLGTLKAEDKDTAATRSYPIAVLGPEFDDAGNSLRETATFNDDETPILEFMPAAHTQPGWNLFFIGGGWDIGVDGYWIGGGLEDREWAIQTAQDHLNRIGYAGGAR